MIRPFQIRPLRIGLLRIGLLPHTVFRTALSLCMAAFLLAACDVSRVPAEAPLPAISQEDGRVEWRGVLPCADCDGIETLLVLERRGQARRYDLVETFLAARDGARFAESGQWRMQGAALSLDGEGGASRHYVLLPDGRLQPQDGRGRPFRLRGDVLLPVEPYVP
jgi:copper homeostasis protein (lipoprotein)